MAVMILAIGIGIILEQFMPSSVFMGFARPPVLALIVAYYALNHSAPMMLAAALLGGILSDGISSLPLGTNPLAFAAIGAVLHHYRGTVFSGKIVTNIVFGAVIGMSVTLILFMLLLFLGQTHYSLQPRMIFLRIIGTMIYGAVFSPVIYALLERLELLTGAGLPACPRRLGSARELGQGILHRFPDDNNSNN